MLREEFKNIKWVEMFLGTKVHSLKKTNVERRAPENPYLLK